MIRDVPLYHGRELVGQYRWAGVFEVCLSWRAKTCSRSNALIEPWGKLLQQPKVMVAILPLPENTSEIRQAVVEYCRRLKLNMQCGFWIKALRSYQEYMEHVLNQRKSHYNHSHSLSKQERMLTHSTARHAACFAALSKFPLAHKCSPEFVEHLLVQLVWWSKTPYTGQKRESHSERILWDCDYVT